MIAITIRKAHTECQWQLSIFSFRPKLINDRKFIFHQPFQHCIIRKKIEPIHANPTVKHVKLLRKFCYEVGYKAIDMTDICIRNDIFQIIIIIHRDNPDHRARCYQTNSGFVFIGCIKKIKHTGCTIQVNRIFLVSNSSIMTRIWIGSLHDILKHISIKITIFSCKNQFCIGIKPLYITIIFTDFNDTNWHLIQQGSEASFCLMIDIMNLLNLI